MPGIAYASSSLCFLCRPPTDSAAASRPSNGLPFTRHCLLPACLCIRASLTLSNCCLFPSLPFPLFSDFFSHFFPFGSISHPNLFLFPFCSSHHHLRYYIFPALRILLSSNFNNNSIFFLSPISLYHHHTRLLEPTATTTTTMTTTTINECLQHATTAISKLTTSSSHH